MPLSKGLANYMALGVASSHEMCTDKELISEL